MDITTKIKMNNGVAIPVLGLGTYLSRPGNDTYVAVRYALDSGYRHIDTAAMYANEKDVGKAVKDSKIPREEIFITTKVWNEDQGYGKTLKAFDESLIKLDSGYIDLYLIHWPLRELRRETWKALEKKYHEGKVRSIGVSNYTVRHLDELLLNCSVNPAVNQVELSPYLQQPELLEYCSQKDIVVQAYSPLVRGRKFDDVRLIGLAHKYSKTPAQILIRWSLQMNTVTLPKSVRKEKIEENVNVFDFNLSNEDLEFMKTFDESFRIAWNPSNIP
jgi:diketogulonate reductase-like aldo/keto reductase